MVSSLKWLKFAGSTRWVHFYGKYLHLTTFIFTILGTIDGFKSLTHILQKGPMFIGNFSS